ncbi:RING-H2 finger protein ATL39-like [Phragmites australis]|uniref:RING-H2 finger protein ATL39-like n=1 Tax=Phragmites australis TaxID=29695 RepID=UPI002D76DAEF|nr:RING-H2 finger protein ATL39-like [Phragmites australis]
MPNLLSARSRARSNGGGGGGNDDGGIGNRACYGIAASAMSLLLFCALAASVSVWIAFAFGGLALVAFAVASCLGPASWRVGPSDGVIAERDAAAAGSVGAARAPRRFGLPEAAINALPTFAYELKGAKGDLESGAGSEACSVCLEDMLAGEMVRQLPTCKHLFHVECIDMWLHSHRTCPVCRCNLSAPRRKVPGKAAPAPAPAAEAEPPADDASPQV